VIILSKGEEKSKKRCRGKIYLVHFQLEKANGNVWIEHVHALLQHALPSKKKQASAGHHKRQKQSIKLLELFPAAKNSSRLSDIVKLTLQDLLKIEKLFLGH